MADKNKKQETAKEQLGPMSVDAWDDIVGQRIAAAQDEGFFDNLPGKGKPLKIRKNTYAGDWQLAYDIMEDNDIPPAWIGNRKEIQTKIAGLRRVIERDATYYRGEFSKASDEATRHQLQQNWSHLIEKWENDIVELNLHIGALNIEQPLEHLEIIKVRLDDELAKAGVRRTL